MSSDIVGRLKSVCNDHDNMPRMSTELVRSLRVFDVTEVINTIEALEEQAELNGGVAIEWKLKAEAAEARSERLRAELQMVLDEFGYSLPLDTKASITKALEGSE